MSEQDIPGAAGTESAEAEVVLDADFDSPLASNDVEEIEDLSDLDDVADLEELEDVDDLDAAIDLPEVDDLDVEDLGEVEDLEDDSEPAPAGDTESDAGAVVVADTASDLDVPELTVDQAQELTEHIRSTSDVLYVLVARAHAGKAHKALGYSDFGAYVKAEFDISRSRAYQFINQAAVIKAIEEATPEGTKFKLSEAAARDLKNYVEELAPEIRDATADLDPNEAGSVVEEMVSDYRDKLTEEKNKVEDDLDMDFDLDDIQYDAPEFDGEGGGGGSQFDDMEGFDNIDGFDDEGTGEENEDRSIDIEDASVFRNKLENVYAFYAALNSLEKMPDVQEILDSIQESRRPHLNASLPKAKAWLDAMYEAWFADQDAPEKVAPAVSTDKPVASDDDEDLDIDTDFDGPAWEEDEETSESSDDEDFDFDNEESEPVREDTEDTDDSK